MEFGNTGMSSATGYKYNMDIFKQLCKIIGAKIRFKVPEGEFEGIIQQVLPKYNRVTMDHVYFLPKRSYMGTSHFSFREILSFSVLETAEEIGYIHSKCDYVSCNLDGIFDEQSKCLEDSSYPNKMKIDDFVLILPPDLRHELPYDNVIIDAINSDFFLAIKHILKQKMIGVAFEGPKISRSGKLSWVCICTPSCLFLFDIELLGKAAFNKGLRNIFQHKSVKKVIHDCRQASDCLLHLFDTELVNVFDTQVADFIATMQKYSDKPAFKYVGSLDGCLLNYLNVPPEYLHNRKKYLSDEEEVIFYSVRPVSNDYIDVLIKNTVYLCLLKDKLLKLMLNPFHKAVNVYLNELVNATEPELLVDTSVSDMVPPPLVIKSLQKVQFAEIEELHIDPFVCKFKELQKGTDKINEEPTANSKNQSVDAVECS